MIFNPTSLSIKVVSNSNSDMIPHTPPSPIGLVADAFKTFWKLILSPYWTFMASDLQQADPFLKLCHNAPQPDMASSYKCNLYLLMFPSELGLLLP